jgi:glycosyltransferase involved in cell wall biosynthesis
VKIIFICTKSITFNTFLNHQANYFLKKGIKVEIGCSDIENLNTKKILKHQIKFPIRFLDFFSLTNYLKIFFQINKLVLNNRKAIFYLHTPLASHLFRLFVFFHKIKIIYFIHGLRFTHKTKFFKAVIFKLIEKILSFKTNLFITINHEDYEYIKKNFSKKKLIYKINGVGLNISKNFLKKKIKIKKDIKKILVISAYKKDKGYFEILKVAEKLQDKKIKIECYGYGNFSKYNSLKKKKKINNIFFYNFDKNLKNKIKKYDLLLHLSKREGLPVSVQEALVEGLPVICYNIRGNNDLIINKYNGYFTSSYKEIPNIIQYLKLHLDIFNKLRVNAVKSINKNFFKKNLNLKIYNIFKNFNKNSK